MSKITLSSVGSIHSKIVWTRFLKAISASLRVMCAIKAGSIGVGSGCGLPLCVGAKLFLIAVYRLLEGEDLFNKFTRLAILFRLLQHINQRRANRLPVAFARQLTHPRFAHRDAPAGDVGRDDGRPA